MSRLQPTEASLRRSSSREALPGSAAEDPDFVASAARGLKVLEAFTPEFAMLGNGDIAQRSGLPRSTVSRLTYTLSRLGYLDFDSVSQRYRLGAAMVNLARSFLGGRGARAIARPYMEALALRYRSPVSLTEREGLEMVYLEYCRGDAPVIVPRGVGSHVGLMNSASGRAWLATAPDVEVEAVLVQASQREAYDAKRVRKAFDAARADLQRRGFTRSYGDVTPEVNSVAVPMISPVDGALMVFNIAAPAMLASATRFDRELGPALLAMSAQVRARLASPVERAA